METKFFDHLPEYSKDIRTKVFMEEQGFEQEFDDIDAISTHIVLFVGNKPIATCRFFYSDIRGCHVIGRIAVLKEYRGHNYGATLVREAERVIAKQGAQLIGLSAQEQAIPFYRKMGYALVGDTYLVEGCPHIWMEKEMESCEH